ncbi:MAG: recombinase family protein [Deltaproteobacteria bacterium]|nr:recombinase family protein [Deltaproteobacteria bacterium]
MKALSYCRVSTVEQTVGTSIQNQISMIESYCAMKSIELTTVYIDGGVSGSIPLSKRPEGKRLVETICTQTGPICVVMTKLDRGFRSASDCLNNVEKWEHLNIGLHILNLGGQTIDTSSPAGKFFITVMAGAAELERNMIRERCNEGRKIRKSQGRRLGQIPFGYTIAEDSKTLIPDPKEIKAVLRIRQLAKPKVSYREICRKLECEGYQSRSGGSWNHHTVKSILQRGA